VKFALSLSVALLVITACGDDVTPADSAVLDTGVVDSANVDSGPVVSVVAAPALPDFGECPVGWRQVPHATIPDLVVCDPWPEGGPADCAPHEAHFPGEPGCIRVGTVCPADGWPADLPPADVVYVRADAPAGGDGTRADPFRTVSEGVDAVVESGTVAVAVGEYVEPIVLARGLTILGACAEGVVLSRGGGGGLPHVSAFGRGLVTFENLTFRSENRNRLSFSSTSIAAREVIIDGAGITQFDGDVELVDVVVFDVPFDSTPAISLAGDGHTSIRRLVMHDIGSVALNFTRNETAALEDVAIHDCEHIGAFLDGSELTVSRMSVERVDEMGLSMTGDSSVVEDLLVRDVGPGTGGGVGFFSEQTLELRRARIEQAAGAHLSHIGAPAMLADVVISGATPDGATTGGRGVEVGFGARVEATRVAIAHTADLGILVADAATTASFTDLWIDEVQPAATGTFGRCIHAQVRAEVAVERAALTRCREVAVTASFFAAITLRDVTISRVLPLSCEEGACDAPVAGIGMVALPDRGQIDAERFVIAEAALAGVQVVEGGEIDLRDGTIRDSPVGVNVQNEGYDLSRLMDRVVFVGNGNNLDTTALPVPQATAGGG